MHTKGLAKSGTGIVVAVALLFAGQVAHAERYHVIRGGTVMNLGAGFLIGGGAASPGVGIGFSTHISRTAPVYLGIDTGSYFHTSPFAWIIPIMPTIKYLFFGNTALVPTLGLSLGPVFGIGDYNSVSFGMLFKPGVQININRQLDFFFEPRLGVIGSIFTFDPELSAVFQI